MNPIKAVLLPVGEEPKLVTLQSYQDYNKSVGGPIERVGLEQGASAYVNENGIAEGLRINMKATVIVALSLSEEGRELYGGPAVVMELDPKTMQSKNPIPHSDEPAYLRGSVLFVGPVVGEDDSDIPDWFIAKFFPDLES